jgi:hypothetical protein
MKKKVAVMGCAGAVLVVGGVMLAARYAGLSSIKGRVGGGTGVRETRVVLLQGPDVQMLAFMGLVAPGTDLRFTGHETAKWVTADPDGNFYIGGVRWEESTVIGLTEFEDGRICQTSQADLHPTLGFYHVELLTPGTRCWRRAQDPHSQ